MTTRSASRLGLAAIFLAAAAGCGSSGTKTGTLNVYLVDGPGDEFQEVNVHVLQVSVHSDTEGWKDLPTHEQSVNLLSLTDVGLAAKLVGTTIEVGHYTQMRLLLGATAADACDTTPRTGNTVVLTSDGSCHALTVPSGLQSGIKIIVNFDVAPGTTRDIFIDFDAHKSIFVHGTGASGKYILRPTIRAVDRLATGSISGTLTGNVPVSEGSTTVPLPGALVTAQVVDGGVASIVGSATTGADGTYTIALLPVGTYRVVSQPVVSLPTFGMIAFFAKASPPITIAEATPTGTFSAVFDAVVLPGAVGGSITPTATADDADTVYVRQDFAGTSLIVRTADGVVGGTPLAETYAIALVPPGTYSVSDTRRTLDPGTGIETVKFSPAVTATVVAGLTATADLVLPP